MSYYTGKCEDCDAEWKTSGYESECPFCKIENLEVTTTPNHSALVRELVEVLGEAEAIALDHINLLENQGWTRHQADEIKMAHVMLENIQQALTKAREAGF